MSSVSGFVIALVFAAISAFVALVAFRMVNYLHNKIDENYLEKHYIFDKGFPGNPEKP
jgi:hypothetical protein